MHTLTTFMLCGISLFYGAGAVAVAQRGLPLVTGLFFTTCALTGVAAFFVSILPRG